MSNQFRFSEATQDGVGTTWVLVPVVSPPAGDLVTSRKALPPPGSQFHHLQPGVSDSASLKGMCSFDGFSVILNSHSLLIWSF